MEEVFNPQIEEHYEEQASSEWPLQQLPIDSVDLERQIKLRTRIAEYLEAQRRLEVEIARQAEEKRVREEQIRLEEERKKLEAEAKEEKKTGIGDWDPILISLVRRAMPSLMAYDICGVQPMSEPTGLIFSMRSKYEAEGKLDQKPERAVVDEVKKQERATWERENHLWAYSTTQTVNSATRKKQAEKAAAEREEMRQDYLRRRKGYPVILESKETPIKPKSLDETEYRETMNKQTTP